jgi:hypothetical protein
LVGFFFDPEDEGSIFHRNVKLNFSGPHDSVFQNT